MANNYQDSLDVARHAPIGAPVIIGENSHGVILERTGDTVTVSWTVSTTTTTVPAKTWAEMGMTLDQTMIEVSDAAARAYLAQGGTFEGAVEFGARQAIAYYRALQFRATPTREPSCPSCGAVAMRSTVHATGWACPDGCGPIQRARKLGRV